MIRAFILAAVLFAVPVIAQDAGAVSDAGVMVAVTADAGVRVAETGTPVVAPPPTGLPDADVNLGWVTDMAKQIRQAVQEKAWGRMLFLIITALVVVMKKLVIPRVKFLQAKIVPLILTFLWAGFGMLATTWGAGEKLSAGDVYLALQAATMAAGGWSILKAVLEHFVPKEADKKNWATVLLDLLGAGKAKEAPAPAPTPAPGA